MRLGTRSHQRVGAAVEAADGYLAASPAGCLCRRQETITEIERAVAVVIASKGVAGGALAAFLHEFDGVDLRPPYAVVAGGASRRQGVVCSSSLPGDVDEVDGFPCTSGTRTLFDLAPLLDDVHWEQALESALRRGLSTIAEIEHRLDFCRRARVRGSARIRRVLALRPADAPPTGSALETRMVQLLRKRPSLPEPVRQFEVRNQYGFFVGRPDLAWPDVGLFLELDGQQHKGQPVYDASRETLIVATTGWLPGRFTWYEVTSVPNTTLRRVADLYAQARRRSLI